MESKSLPMPGSGGDITRRAMLLAGAMVAASAAAYVLRPGEKAAAKGKAFDLSATVPQQFGAWRAQAGPSMVVNPQTQALLDKIYSQVLSRTYANEQGYRVMLSLAYGDDQRGGLEAHKPEVCYPAQGFKLQSNVPGELETPFGRIPVRRLHTSLGARQEPITYWFVVGERAIGNRIDKRLSELRLALTGQIPDGLLFRISSIDENQERAFAMHRQYVIDLLGGVPVDARQRLSGLGPAVPSAPAA